MIQNAPPSQIGSNVLLLFVTVRTLKVQGVPHRPAVWASACILSITRLPVPQQAWTTQDYILNLVARTALLPGLLKTIYLTRLPVPPCCLDY